jgi:hypothetical protein
MPNLIEAALDAAYELVFDPTIAGELVTLVRGAQTTAIYAVFLKSKTIPPALLGLSPGQMDTANPSPKNIDHDFAIQAADYRFGGTLADPRQGDRIKRTVSGVVHVFELMASSGTGAVYELMDGPYKKCFVVHTKFVKTE